MISKTKNEEYVVRELYAEEFEEAITVFGEFYPPNSPPV